MTKPALGSDHTGPCPLCNGTGKRKPPLGSGRWQAGCNVCNGTGHYPPPPNPADTKEPPE